MMSSNQGRRLINPLVQSKMEGAVGTAVPPALPKADSIPHYSHDKALPISRGYFSYSLSGQDALDFNSLWDSSKNYVRNGSSPGIHPSATEGSITIPGIYRPENMSFPVDGGGRSSGPQRLAYYASSPRHHSPRHHSPRHHSPRHHSPRHHSPAAGVISPMAVPKSRIVGSEISSTDAEGCVGLAVPKPVYGHSSCCTERGCAHNYGVEHGPHRMSPRIYDDEWAAHFSRLAYLHKKGQEALAQQRALQFEHGAEGIPLKDGKTEGYHGIRSNGPGRSLPLMEPSHSSYTYNTAHPFIATTEYCQRAPVPLQIHRGLPTAYDPRTMTHHGVPPKVYPDRSHVPKYTQIPPCSSVYYPHTETYRADSNAITDEHAQHHHMPQFHSPRPDFTNISTSCSVVPPHHPLITKYPPYHPYGVRLNSNQAPVHERPLSIHQSERPLDFSLRRVQTPDSPRELCRQSGTPGAFHPTPANYRRSNSTTAERSFEHSEVAGTGFLADGCKELIPKSDEKEHRHRVSDLPNKDSLPKRHRHKSDDSTEIDVPVKKQKTEAAEQPDESPSCPPMPVINKVFSLAPYKIYFEATGMLPPQGNSESPQPEPTWLKQEPDIQSGDLEANSGENDLGPKREASPANSNGQAETEETVKIKKEKLDPDETAYQSEMKVCVIEEMNNTAPVKEEQGELDESMPGSVPNNIVIKNDLEDINPPLEEKSESCNTENAEKDRRRVVSEVPTLLSPLTKYPLDKIPPHCLKLSNFKIIIPEVLKAPTIQPVDIPQSPVEVKPIISSGKQARHQFMELHQSLCRLINSFVTRTPCQELKDWLCKLDLRESSSHSSKPQRVACLLGSKIREVWLKSEETVMALQNVVCQLQKYIESRECPFPHVMRAGAVFIPMLVVKEVLFPQVQGTFIDQVLQEHRVELRPTTLSEERQLIQLHRKAFSSKLRRLLSLKHLPDIYPDVLNLLYYANVCKFLGAKTSLTFTRESTNSSDDSTSRVNGPDDFYLKSTTLPTSERTCFENPETTYFLKTQKKKGRVKISSKRTFLDETSSSQEDDYTEEPVRWTIVNTFEVSPVAFNGRDAHVEVKIEDDTREETDVASWRRPLTSDDLECSDEESECTSSLSYQSQRSSSAESQSLPKGPSSMVLKLRKVFFSEGHRGRVTHYQKVTDSLEAQGGLRGHDRFRSATRDRYKKKKHKSSKHKRRHTDREFSLRLHRSYPQNCSYISRHRSKRRRRWVLRSAVQSARLAMENRFPDLVGKRIRHLYEEKDKTEVWYRGVVLRIHEPHTNPLKTVFEVKYDSEPEWQYYLELLLDYKKGWLKVED